MSGEDRPCQRGRTMTDQDSKKKEKGMFPRPDRRQILVFAAGAFLAACTPDVVHHGYLPRKGDFEKIHEGMTKAEVESILGTPSTTATVDIDGDSYYYISSVTKQSAFFKPEIVDRKVFAIRFDREGRVKSFALYGLEDGQIINISDRTTPTPGREMTILQQLFSNLTARPSLAK